MTIRAPQAEQPETGRRRWAVLAVVSAAQFLIILDLWVVNIALPALQYDFAPATLSDVSWPPPPLPGGHRCAGSHPGCGLTVCLITRPPPAAKGEPVVSRDGSAVLIQQVQSATAPPLADGFGRPSDATRRMRFLTKKDELSAAELRYFTDIDHHDHETLGAVNPADGRGVSQEFGRVVLCRKRIYPGVPSRSLLRASCCSCRSCTSPVQAACPGGVVVIGVGSLSSVMHFVVGSVSI